MTRDADARYTVASTTALALVRHVEGRGIDPRGLLTPLGLDLDALADVDGRVTQTVYNRLFEAAAQRSGDVDFGLHFAEAASPEAFHVVGELAVRAPTLGDAFERIARYSRIVHDAGRVEVEPSADAWTLHPGCRGLPHDVPRAIAEYSAASVVVLSRAMTRTAIVPRRVAFRHAEPASTVEHRRILGVEPSFGAPETTLVFATADVRRPVVAANASLSTLLEHLARGLLERLSDDGDLPARVSAEIAKRLEHGSPELADVARALGTSARTLQRRLEADETSFQALVDSVRRRCAERYVRDARLSAQEIAFLLGFSDPSNFHRAFRRWFGVSPTELRSRGA